MTNRLGWLERRAGCSTWPSSPANGRTWVRSSATVSHFQTKGPLPALLVVHENRGLNPHIEDVTRQLALAGYLATPRYHEAAAKQPWDAALALFARRLKG